ncbi:DUF4250 domain-containing protein [Clostridium sp. BIOML-A1]|jgi:hypothetical protein|uniref:DUF4250 domain-containing protein n=1 Tax=Clostridium sp. BIOML-A1 TaxID=2584627 RepID=UPI00136EBE74|nr:DUF4250 domain-containing protein [Clostridium sp. BIOML-A1]MZH17741.1 DUF4250 domain-containing protein [Clostridium sp. BIOML-A1]
MANSNIPKDPVMLLSFINMKLRDFYPSLDELCADLNLNVNEVSEKLASAGFNYDGKLNRFI